MKTGLKMALTAVLCVLILIVASGVGSVGISPADILKIFNNKLFAAPLGGIADITADILWNIRLPRSLMAFLVGSALAASGTVMQSVLRNPLASSYTLGVSSGASLGAAIVILSGAALSSFAGMFTLPLVGFIFGLGTVFLAMGLTARFDCNMENHTIVLVGMVLSLFVNAVLTLVTALSREHLQQLVFWQMGSFSAKDWTHVAVVLPILIVCLLYLMFFTNEMDIMTFGEEQALSSGVDIKKVKFRLIAVSALLTGASVAFCGTIGFIDLIAPHVVRKIFGSSHRLVLPASALFGGAFMAAADLVSRTVLAPQELPVGAVTALIGAPFFAYIYFKKRGRAI